MFRVPKTPLAALLTGERPNPVTDDDPAITAPPPQTPDGCYVLDDQIGYILRVASQRHSTIFQDHALDGLTPMQFSALVRVAELGSCSQNRLGRLTSMDVATIKGVVDRLKRKGLITLERDSQDKRRTLIRLTPQAETMIVELYGMGHRISAETLRPLSAEEQTTLIGLLRKIT